MTAQAIGNLVAELRGKADFGSVKIRRTGAPVRRCSYHEGERERQVWRPIADGSRRAARRWISAFMQAAEQYDRSKKAAGRRNGALGHIALEVLRELFRLVDYKTGRLEPAIETLQRATRRSRAAVVAALRRLKDHGFLTWIRRTEPTDNEGAGPQVRQITNAYGFDLTALPKRAAIIIRTLLGRAPQPDDDAARRAEDAAELERMITSLPPSEQGSARAADPALAEALNSLGRSMQEREFTERSESGL